MRQVVAPAGDQRPPAAAARHRDQRRVENDKAEDDRGGGDAGGAGRDVRDGSNRDSGEQNPSGMLPPSPMKIRAGRLRLCGRKPAHAPEIATHSAARAGSEFSAASAPAPAAETPVTVAAAPSMLSIRLTALTMPTTQTQVRMRSRLKLSKTAHPLPVANSTTPAGDLVASRR